MVNCFKNTLLILALLAGAPLSEAFLPLRTTTTTTTTLLTRVSSPSNTAALRPLFAKKKGGKGFAKKVETPEAQQSPPSPASTQDDKGGSSSADASSLPFLQSVEGGSTELPQQAAPPSTTTKKDDDGGLTPEERAKKLLRDTYGLQTLEEQRMNEKQLEQVNAQRKRMAELKAKADAGEDLDLIAMIPGPVIKGIYAVLQAGIAITGTAFILSGLGITLEAWSTTSGDALPENIDSFITNTIEPNFTTMLLVLLGFSVSLGALAAAQLGSKSAQYREEE